jgi:hypothetical protein
MLPYIFADQPKETSSLLAKHKLVLLITINVYLLCFYYINTLLLIPKLLFAKKWILYLIIVATFFTLFIYVPRPVSYWLANTTEEKIREEFRQQFKQRMNLEPINNDSAMQNTPPPSKMNRDSLGKMKRDSMKFAKRMQPPRNNNFALRYYPGSFVVFLLIFTIGLCISVMQQWIFTERNRRQIELEKTNTELSFLKSQVNPHFFFNTLNNIYSLAVVQSDKTAPTVMRLSSMMRYILTETQTPLVPIEKEIDFIRNFIDLQLVRLTDKVTVNFATEGNIDGVQVAPLLFISFVENAFKYGVSTKESSTINILFKIIGNKVQFSVVNTIVKSDNGIQNHTGIGLNNATRRLELLYPEKHQLTVHEENNIFKVQLEIQTL